MPNEKLKLRGLTYDYQNKQGLHFLTERLQRRCPAYDCGHCITEYPKSKK